jgi:hypothetical protein
MFTFLRRAKTDGKLAHAPEKCQGRAMDRTCTSLVFALGRSLLAASALALVSACSAISLTDGSGGGGSKAVADTSDAGSDAADASRITPTAKNIIGANCGTERATGVTLCLEVSACPGVRADPDLSPGCGFRIQGSAYDLQCLCDDGSLCPMGTTTTCAARLLANMSAYQVCAQRFDDRCAQPRAKR